MSAHPPAAVCHPEGHCITCSDEGVPMRVLALAADGLAACEDADGAVSEVDLGLVEPVDVGEEVLVHAGVALALLVGAEAGPGATAEAPA